MDRGKQIKVFLLAAGILMVLPWFKAIAASDDFGVWTEVGVEKKLNKKWAIDLGGEYRTRNNSKTADRWSLGVDGEYKIVKWLRLSAGFSFLYNNNTEKLTYNTNGTYNNYRPSFWSSRYRFNISVTGKTEIKRWSFSLRERWQYTYRPEHTTDRYDFDNEWWEETDVKGKGRNVLRSKLKIDYNIPKCKIDPYVEGEIFNAWNLQKVRYTVGAEYVLNKKHCIDICYRYQTVNEDDDEQPNRHILGLSYKFKF